MHDWSLLGGQGDFVGLDNYRHVFADRFFWNALRNTFSIFLLSSVPQVVIALVVRRPCSTASCAAGRSGG